MQTKCQKNQYHRLWHKKDKVPPPRTCQELAIRREFHRDSLGLTGLTRPPKGKGRTSRHKREKGRRRPAPPATKGKREGDGTWISGPDLTRHPNRAHARTHDTKRFPGWTHPPNLPYTYCVVDVFPQPNLGSYFS